MKLKEGVRWSGGKAEGRYVVDGEGCERFGEAQGEMF